MKKAIPLSLFIVVHFACISGDANAGYNLSLTVPSYGQDTGNYCGAASGQLMMGYPGTGAGRCISQDNIYNTIQPLKQDTGFFTDPDGLKDSVMNLNPPAPPGRYSIFHGAGRDNVMHGILYWMASQHFPARSDDFPPGIFIPVIDESLAFS